MTRLGDDWRNAPGPGDLPGYGDPQVRTDEMEAKEVACEAGRCRHHEHGRCNPRTCAHEPPHRTAP